MFKNSTKNSMDTIPYVSHTNEYDEVRKMFKKAIQKAYLKLCKDEMKDLFAEVDKSINEIKKLINS